MYAHIHGFIKRKPNSLGSSSVVLAGEQAVLGRGDTGELSNEGSSATAGGAAGQVGAVLLTCMRGRRDCSFVFTVRTPYPN